MEVRGTTHSIQEIEQLLIKSMPHKIMHDGHFKPEEFSSSKSASNVSAQSEVYSKQYQLFPFGGKQLWEERVNIRFCYDERHGTGTIKVSSRGMHILGMEIKSMQAGMKVGEAILPLENNIKMRGSK